jgi:hypothetical protein
MELWSSSSGPGGRPAVERREYSLGQARTEENSTEDGIYSGIGFIPALEFRPNTLCYIVVYGHRYSNGSAFTTIYL